MGRSYPDKDIKLLWGLSGSICAFPSCHQRCIIDATDLDEAAVIGEIAHIEAHSNNGPRANPKLTPKERDCYNNWILLCPTHHDLVDRQENTFTSEDLRQWKRDHESWVKSRIAEEMPNVTFVELEIITNAILEKPSSPTADFDILGIREKMNRNNLTERILTLLTLGIGKAGEVGDFVQHVALLDHSFPERLKAGFIREYDQLRVGGYEGDALFSALMEFSSGRNGDFLKQAAGLAVLVYLFQKCEVFEK